MTGQQRRSRSCRRGSIREFLENEVFPRVRAKHIYDDPTHAWKSDTEDKLKGGCPFHESKSGRSFAFETGSPPRNDAPVFPSPTPSSLLPVGRPLPERRPC